MRGPNAEPCGTPQIGCTMLDTIDSIHVVCEGSEKYDLIYRRASPVIPTYFSSITNKLLWSIVSKAADKSKRTRNDPFPLPIEVTILLYSIHTEYCSFRAVITLVYGLKLINSGIVLSVRNNTRCNDLFNNFRQKRQI